MEGLQERKLNFNEGLLVSEMLRTIGAKSYVEYMMRQVDKSRKEAEKAKKDKNLTADEIENIEKQSKKNIGIDIAMYIIEHLDMAKEPIHKLISSYSGIEIKKVGLLDLDDVIEIFELMWKSGLPNVLKRFLNIKDTDFLVSTSVPKG